jgi:hypothetical protein
MPVASRNRKYLAWIVKGNFDDTIILATANGSIIAQYTCPVRLRSLSWSPDSLWCFGVNIGQGNEPFPNTTVRANIFAVSIQMPATVNDYALGIGPLSGSNKGTDAYYPELHFKGRTSLVLVSKHTTTVSRDPLKMVFSVQFKEYNLTDTSKVVANYTVDLPNGLRLDRAAFSPQGDKIAWSLLSDNGTEIWISDGSGKKMKRVGKLVSTGTESPDEFIPYGIVWQPDGKGISFREAGELYTVHLESQ